LSIGNNSNEILRSGQSCFKDDEVVATEEENVAVDKDVEVPDYVKKSELQKLWQNEK